MPPTSRPVNYADDGTRLRGVLFKDDTQRSRTPGILLVHGGAGLDAHAREQAERWATLGYAVLACDMYGEGVAGDRDRVVAAVTALRDDPAMLVQRGAGGAHPAAARDRRAARGRRLLLRRDGRAQPRPIRPGPGRSDQHPRQPHHRAPRPPGHGSRPAPGLPRSIRSARADGSRRRLHPGDGGRRGATGGSRSMAVPCTVSRTGMLSREPPRAWRTTNAPTASRSPRPAAFSPRHSPKTVRLGRTGRRQARGCPG